MHEEHTEDGQTVRVQGDAFRCCRHVFIAHGIRINQIREGSAAVKPFLEGSDLEAEEKPMDFEPVDEEVQEEAIQPEQLLEALQNIHAEDPKCL